MANSFSKGKVYLFEGFSNGIAKMEKGVWTGDLKWKGGTAILKMKSVTEEGVYFFVPDNLIIKEAS